MKNIHITHVRLAPRFRGRIGPIEKRHMSGALRAIGTLRVVRCRNFCSELPLNRCAEKTHCPKSFCPHNIDRGVHKLPCSNKLSNKATKEIKMFALAPELTYLLPQNTEIATAFNILCICVIVSTGFPRSQNSAYCTSGIS